MIEFLLKNKENILKKIDDMKNIKEDVYKHWNVEEFKCKDLYFAGGDGSYNKIDYISFTFYGVGAISYLHKEKINKIKEFFEFNVGNPLDIEERLKIYMQILELKLAYYTLKNYDIDYYLYDGSLFSLLISAKTELPKEVEEKFNKYYGEINNKIDDEIEKGDFSIDEELWDVEYLCILKKLVEDYRDKLVGISKTSKINIYFDEKIPDMSIFAHYTNEEGYTTPIDFYMRLGEEKKEKHRQLSSVLRGIHYLEKNFNIKINNAFIQFVRLEKNKCILGLTSFSKPNKDILYGLKRISVNGYPYLLKVAHENVEINNKKIHSFAKIVGINELEARYMLK
ncbi:DNA double-strand break repair nuclease NurA [Methanocaldococcus indicus]|uniref:DNA double-strand break repair nuclease NurA n=1 Tax=Methanocaldococcus indicus TaxID=213231 RepID=UPI003C6DA278